MVSFLMRFTIELPVVCRRSQFREKYRVKHMWRCGLGVAGTDESFDSLVNFRFNEYGI